MIPPLEQVLDETDGCWYCNSSDSQEAGYTKASGAECQAVTSVMSDTGANGIVR